VVSGGGEAAGRGRLERRYRRLLRWYPQGHQARHGAEMLGVLLAAAGPAQERPRLRESANLIGGALRIRLRGATTGSAGQWRDALARAAILLPLAALTWRLAGDAMNLVVLTERILLPRHLPAQHVVVQMLIADARRDGPWLGLVIALLAGWRRIALAATAVVSALVIGNLVLFRDSPPYLQPGDAMTLSVLGILALGLALVKAPPGWALLRWRHVALTVLAALALTAADALSPVDWLVRDRPGGLITGRFYEVAVGAVIVIMASLMLAASPGSRRLLAIAALPLYFLWVSEFDLARLFPGVPIYLPGVTSADILLVWLPLGAAVLAAILLAGLVLARRARGRASMAGGTAR
jgi:hypothetical protein